MARRLNSRRRRLSLEALGVAPRGRLRRALPAVRRRDVLAAALLVIALVVVLNHRGLATIASGGADLETARRLGGSLAVVGFLAALGLVYLVRFERQLLGAGRRLVVFGTCCLGCVGAAEALMAADAQVVEAWRGLVLLTPVAAFAIFFAVVYGQRAAISGTIMLSLLVGLAAGVGPAGAARPMTLTLVLMSGGLVAALASRTIRGRLKLLNVGLLVGLVQAALFFGLELWEGRAPLERLSLSASLWCFANGVGVGVVMTLLLPFIEVLFNVATEMRLLELSDQERPLLRALVARAPSTDNHSRRVALLAEAAAEAIGANSLLTLVASYYHDIGKITKPEFFIENQVGPVSPHDRLRPSMSALIIASHTRDGVELAREAKLPKAIIDIIAQHHGTSVIEFFYNRYLQEAGDKPALDESFFRYPGPKPRSKEAAIVLLADAVEAASRTLSEPVPSRIETLVRRITTAKLLDGQLEESGLTLSELHRIEQALFRVLCSMYHARIEYPTTTASRRRTVGARAAAALSVDT